MKQIPQSLKIILSGEEAKELQTRLQVAELLKKGATYRDIISKTHVGAATIARISKKLHLKEASSNKNPVTTTATKINLNQYAFGISHEEI